ncbi:MAG: alpha-amylase [Lentimicrobiaceae bacterium]|jgi:maltose alpha-D-glucosyltransferase/alpha-amylase|nr:alpha-amylase [Lentimicrobiaceae bacterium]MCP4909448.1 alpha-amylase [Bacteroidota bacterium]MBT3454132.1 alpha-amylase [Lentimicrobiaceae bacterium]MBT3819334.1 alpha-amylase [Lentimicrobiaceae bacterium]MBT4061007.1 alpha-amylase [Lentimicrobiaceae bacterium]
MTTKLKLYNYWNQLYPDLPADKLDVFISNINVSDKKEVSKDWFKDAIVYSLYVNLYNEDFYGLTEKLDYIKNLGINCLWLLPILQSPMRDAGFDISKYDRIRPSLLGLSDESTRGDQEVVFGSFLEEAHKRGIRVIFDVAINHTSDEHPWFIDSQKNDVNEYTDFYIWSDKPDKYLDARLLFKGIEDSNWEKLEDKYYFHRFFSFQPDLNYRNPDVLLAMTKNLLYWQENGVDGFRADAIPYLWKEDGTDCENLEMTHIIVKFFRAALEYVNPETLLLAEACQKPKEVVKYLGNNDECHAAYHFPLMPMIYKSIASANSEPIKHTLSNAFTPEISDSNQWFTFLRVHDELSLELVYVSEEDRKYIYDSYCHDPSWDFRVGEGISARLSELMQKDVNKIGLAYSIMLTLLGTPVIYYGDEFGKLNDKNYYKNQIKLTGKDDTRFLVRGKIDWMNLEQDLKQEDNFHSQVFGMISSMLNTRKDFTSFGRGDLNFIDVVTDNPHEILSYVRKYSDEKILVLNNLSAEKQVLRNPLPDNNLAVLNMNGFVMDNDHIILEPHGFVWILVI